MFQWLLPSGSISLWHIVNKEAVHGFQRIATRLPTTWLVLLTMIGYPKKRRRKKSKQTSKLKNIQTNKQNQKKAKKGVCQSRIVSVTKGWTGKTTTKFGKVKGENRKAQDRIVFTTLLCIIVHLTDGLYSQSSSFQLKIEWW